jgi:dihydropteroate synthase
MAVLECGGREIDLKRVAVMGILNITPDSFSDGGVFMAPDIAVTHAMEMAEQGATIIDVGGESTRPGAQAVPIQEEMDRVLPVIEALKNNIDAVISIDTSKAEVMREAVKAGAGLINDVNALRGSGAMAAASESKAAVCLMHMQGEPRTMQDDPEYDDVVADVCRFLSERINAAAAAGIPREKLLVDPGFGFGKALEHNKRLLRQLDEIGALGIPVLAGLSRKSMIGTALGLPVEQRLYASVALALVAAQNGARIIRVHDVAPTVQAIRMWEAVYKD